MSAQSMAERGDTTPARSKRRAKTRAPKAGIPPLVGRKSVLMGLLTSGFVVANAAQPTAHAATIKPLAATTPAYVSKWAPATAYVLGQQVASPNNDVVSAKSAHVSSVAFATDSLKWALSSTYGGVVKTSDHGLHVSATGSDTNDGLSPATAKLTLASAIANIPAGSVVKLGRGRHTITSLNPAKAIRIVGSGTVFSLQPWFGDGQAQSANNDNVGGTVLHYAGTTGDAIRIIGNTATRNFSLSDLTLLGPGSGTSRGLVLGDLGDPMGQAVRMNVERVNVTGFATGILTTAENSKFDSVYVSGCLTGMYTTGAFNGNTIVNLNIERCTNYGLRMTDSDSNIFTGGVIQGNSGHPLSLENLAYGNTFMGIYFEQASAPYNVDIGVVGPSDFNALIGCHWSGNPPPIRIAGNHTSLHGSIYCPAVTLSGSYNNLQGTFNGGVTDTGTNNYVLNLGAGTMKLNRRAI
jgi:hypothetical protein